MSDDHEDELLASPGIQLPPISLGTVIAERRIALHQADGQEGGVLVRVGLPVPVPISAEAGFPESCFRCPAQIIGLGIDEKIVAPPGLDAFEAIYNALDFIGQQVDYRTEQLKLTNPCKATESRNLTWIWKYPPTE